MYLFKCKSFSEKLFKAFQLTTTLLPSKKWNRVYKVSHLFILFFLQFVILFFNYVGLSQSKLFINQQILYALAYFGMHLGKYALVADCCRILINQHNQLYQQDRKYEIPFGCDINNVWLLRGFAFAAIGKLKYCAFLLPQIIILLFNDIIFFTLKIFRMQGVHI